MALRFYMSLLVLIVTLSQFTNAYEEIHTLNYQYNNETVHSVVDFDAQENWLTHHVFATSDLIGATIAMDEEAGMEVLRPEREKMCYARPIPGHIRSVWDFKSLLEVEEEHNSTSFLPRVTFEEFVGCTSKEIPIERLGKVGYVCRGMPIYELSTLKPPTQTLTSHRRVKRGARGAEGEGRCCSCCSGCNCGGRQKRELLAVELSNRIFNIYNCPPQKIEQNSKNKN